MENDGRLHLGLTETEYIEMERLFEFFRRSSRHLTEEEYSRLKELGRKTDKYLKKERKCK